MSLHECVTIPGENPEAEVIRVDKICKSRQYKGQKVTALSDEQQGLIR
jgi:hypothetical protein